MSDIYQNFRSFRDYPSIEVGPIGIIWVNPNENIPQDQIEELLLDDERKLRDSYKSKSRKFEFERSRWLIRKATGYTDPLGKTQVGAPRWPVGTIGSITHKEGFVGVALEQTSDYLGIGIDAENPKRMKEAFADRVLVASEKSSLEKWSRELGISAEEVMTIIFSFKESIFKCIFPLGGKMFYFPDAEIYEITLNGSIRARTLIDTSPKTPKNFEISGQYTPWQNDEASMYLTSAYIRA